MLRAAYIGMNSRLSGLFQLKTTHLARCCILCHILTKLLFQSEYDRLCNRLAFHSC